MELSCHYYTDAYGHRVCIEVLHPEYAVFHSTPLLEVDIRGLRLTPRRRRYYEYALSFAIQEDQLIWKSLSGEFVVPLLRQWPKIQGVRPSRPMDRGPHMGSNPRLWEYTINQPFDYTGEFLVGKEFLMRYWPRDEKASPIPFRPEVYRWVHRLSFKNGLLVADIPIAENQ